MARHLAFSGKPLMATVRRFGPLPNAVLAMVPNEIEGPRSFARNPNGVTGIADVSTDGSVSIYAISEDRLAEM